ncbi:hypothetical protein F5146DRAFT_995614 [Armillaria mellea]|nr:hypothetical protein F5146DRAFT_995614 [Armillaria mellea]
MARTYSGRFFLAGLRAKEKNAPYVMFIRSTADFLETRFRGMWTKFSWPHAPAGTPKNAEAPTQIHIRYPASFVMTTSGVVVVFGINIYTRVNMLFTTSGTSIKGALPRVADVCSRRLFDIGAAWAQAQGTL